MPEINNKISPSVPGELRSRASTDSEPCVSIFPNVERDVTGRVAPKRLVAVIDIIPDGNDYRIAVSAESSFVHSTDFDERFLP